MSLWTFLSLVMLLVLTTPLNAAVIVDTGVIPCNANSCSGFISSDGHRTAARFNLEDDVIVSNINIWTNSAPQHLGKTFTLAIYTDNTTLPDMSNEILSQNVLITDNSDEDYFHNQWQGLSDLNLNLSAGTYWLSLEMHDGNDFAGYFPTGDFGLLSPVDIYAYYNFISDTWIANPDYDFAFQISGDITPVPTPAAI